MKNKVTLLLALATAGLFSAQIGVNTSTPQATLDVVGKPLLPSSLDGIIAPRLTGDQLRAKTYTTDQTGALVYVTAADTAPAGQTVNVTSPGNYSFDGTIWQAVTTPSLNLPNGTGTLIVINGQQQIAQEISARMSADWPMVNATAVSIGNITTEIIDNYNSFTGTSTTNSFQVANSGTYLVTMNFSIQPQGSISGNCYYGIRSVTDNSWLSRNLETVNLPAGSVKNLGFNVAMELESGKTYTFAIDQTGISGGALVRGQLSGFPSTYFGVKRLK
ncbi:hypothetical protein [Chryseobacterium sp. MA9]|uniref:hypothetical protein n=1 Tax=Chryseobacterium sp. MA9 TaxID=2966625 RepID=UPI0021078AD6|nr:hypothetical protein [Chryseobacterium sp. MA9]UTX48903.1 hypothetical protein KIK00_01140 [Chryseobacterium sp. MA9]